MANQPLRDHGPQHRAQKIALDPEIQQTGDGCGCGLGVLDAAKERNVWGIGVDADQSYLGPQVLTSAEKRVDTSVYSTIKQVLAHKFAGGTNAVFSLANNGVGLGKISPKVPKAEVAKVQQIAKQIAAGKITDIPTEVIAR